MISVKTGVIMGRYCWSKKEEADSLKKIAIWWLKKNGFLDGGWRAGGIKWENSWTGAESSVDISVVISSGDQYLRISYTKTTQDGNSEDFDYEIPLTTTPCYFGGKRYWFICPWYTNGKYCGRRVGVLYLGGKYFACRHCYNLTYNSRNLGGIFKIAGQTISIPELEKLESEVKRKFYAGRMTRKYRRYLKKQDKSLYQLQVIARAFSKK